ncbi:MFS transporter [Pseudonocardia lacus]|uniref:MFS transporter n=1 Tax=Pseudonocardia lacus TaxID=2835865 RepID=UPI001BDD1AC4|nr:MFS transporter [Pseudonocardia lacus]
MSTTGAERPATPEPEQAPAVDVPPAGEGRVGARFLFGYAFAYFGALAATLAPVILTLQLKVAQLTAVTPEIALSTVLGIGALAAIVANPVFGRLSDRTTSRWGMRRPWLVGGVLVALVGLLVVAVAPSIAVMAVGWVIAQLGFAANLSVLIALLADHVPLHQRGSVSGLLGFAQAVATVAGIAVATALSSNNVAMFLVPGLLMLVGTVVLALLLPDRRLAPADRPPLDLGELARSYRLSPRRFPDFSWAWLSRFALWMSISLVLTYQLFFLRARLGLDEAAAAQMVLFGVLAQTATIAVSAFVTGRLSDRFGHRRYFVAAAATVFAIGLLILAFDTTVPVYLVAMVVCGIGQGTYVAVDLALITDVLPDRELDAAKDMGLVNVSSTLTQTLAPAIAPLFLAIGGGTQNYTALFVAGAGWAVISALAVLRVRSAL